jgi:hypothetical protein
MAVNAYWSPLYSWFLAVVLGTVRPSLRSEIPVIHYANLLIFLACMASFEFFWSRVLRSTRMRFVTHDDVSPLPLPVLWVLGYALFIWEIVGSLVVLVTADLCVAVLVFLGAGLLLELHFSEQGLATYALFGGVLGVGYLAKAIMFPMAFVFLAAAIVSQLNRKHAVRLTIALTVFLALAVPEIIVLSHAKGYLTFSDTGKLNVVWGTFGLPYRNWQGQPPGFGVPVHPTRKIYEHPAVFEFNGPIGASYPPWFDPSYWNEGMQTPLDLRAIGKHAVQNGFRILMDFTLPRVWLLAILLMTLWVEPGATVFAISRYWYLIGISGAVFCLYALTFSEYRFMPAWKFLVWAAILSGFRLSRSRANLPVYKWVAALVAIVMLGALANSIRAEYVKGRPDNAFPEYQTAEGLQKMGLQRGDKVGVIGFDNDALWPYLAGFSVVAEINSQDVCAFWSASQSIQSEVLQRFRQAGARVVVANNGGAIKSTTRSTPANYMTCGQPWTGWRQIQGSPNHVYILAEGSLTE